MASAVKNVLIAGEWRPAAASSTFQASSPATGESLEETYPVSSRTDIDAALAAGQAAARELAACPLEARAKFLELYADRIEARSAEICARAQAETALPLSPRLADVELPRTTNQLRLAATAVRDGSWALPTIDRGAGIASMHEALRAPVAIFGPNNFPFAFGSISGGDFAAAIAAGNPVIAKANTGHPGTTLLLAEEAFSAVQEAGLPPATVQLIFRMAHEDGNYLVSHAAIGATGYTGSRSAGLQLKAAADAAGKPIYLELSSVNPVFILPGALEERGPEILDDLVMSSLMGTGQFCTNPGLFVLQDDDASRAFVSGVKDRFASAEPGVLLSAAVRKNLGEAVEALQKDGATVLTGGADVAGKPFRYQNTVLEVSGARFLDCPEAMQREAFGNSTLFVLAESREDLIKIAGSFEGNLTGCIYSHTAGNDDDLYDAIATPLRPLVGRLLNDKMPTGVAVSSAMNHGGPFPATGHPGFTAVGIPGSLRRFSLLCCYDNVREHRLPSELRAANSTGSQWRFIDGEWSQGNA